MRHFTRLFTLIVTLLPVLAFAQGKPFAAVGSPVNPVVEINWQRYYDSEALVDLCQKIAAGHPEIAAYSEAGKSHEGRPIPVLTITNPATGDHQSKTAFYVDGNTHSNEIQASEVTLYFAWYLTEMYDQNDRIQALVDRTSFYFLPTINPDGRDHYMYEPNNMHSPRSGVQPVDDDRDGQIDEDGFDDLDDDGHITMMRRRVKNGTHRVNPSEPRQLLKVEGDEVGHYELLGWEGIDNDGDGRVNEDRTGYTDPNRDWGWWWQPNHIQRGAYKYPFSLPETRAVADFVKAHPNIAGAITYHNTAGMMLYGPGNKDGDHPYGKADQKLYDFIGKKIERFIPGWKYLNTADDLYGVYGGESDWLHGGRGIVAFTGELWTAYGMFNESSDGYWAGKDKLFEFDKHLLFEDAFVDWTPVAHPQYGKIEVGGFKKNYTRDTPGFLILEEAHRNLAFAIHFAEHLPQLEIDSLQISELGDGLTQLDIRVRNAGKLPTHLQHDLDAQLNPPLQFDLAGAEVLARAEIQNPDLGLSEAQPGQKLNWIRVDRIKGEATQWLRFIVRGQTEQYTLKAKGPHIGRYKWTIAADGSVERQYE